MSKKGVGENKKNCVYIEILRQVSPDQPYDNFEYFLLGGFDAMKIGLKENIRDLKKQYEIGQESTPELFDRQPLFLYTSSDMPDIDSADSIFNRHDKFKTIPLIVTLFQLDKIRLAESAKMQTPDDLIESFTTLVGNEMVDQGIKNEEMKFQVFWNLGESDVVVIFRPVTLYVLAKIIHALRMGDGNRINGEIRVISTSSHCAFPKPDINGIEQKSEVKELFKNNLKIWLDEEFKNLSQEFLTLVNISDIYHNPNAKADLLFGEWDYMYRHQKEGEIELASSLADIFTQLICQTDEADFKASYTIPVLKLFPESKKQFTDNNTDNSKDKLYAKMEEKQWIANLYNSMMQLHAQVESALGDKMLLDTLQSLAYSISGIGKFLYRLKEGRFEEDLYAYVKPVFKSLIKITDSFKSKIAYLQKEGRQDAVGACVRSYISDTADLLGKLQHLFSILAVSPHTFMETYGSNMRSLAASDKLLNAYQGVIRFLGDKFPNRILTKTSSHAILLLPYRETQSMHMLLYGQSDPQHRISYIQIDFTKMFDLHSTVFMLLHECGHHLGERLREKRFEYLAKASVCACFEWIGAELFLREPVKAFLMRLNKEACEEDLEREEHKIFDNIPKKDAVSIKKQLNDQIRNAVAEGVRALGRFYTSNVKEMYMNETITNFFGDLKDCYFRNKIVNFLSRRYIPSIFGIHLKDMDGTNDTISRKLLKAYNSQRELLKEKVRTEIADKFAQIARELSDTIAANASGNVREALRVKKIYEDSDVFVDGFLKTASYLVEIKIREGAIENLGEVFSDIYSDVFAIRILNIEMEDYVKIIPCLLGTYIQEISTSPSFLRVFAVLKALWGKKLANNEILVWLSNNDKELEKELRKRWNSYRETSYLTYLTDYAKECDNKMKELVEKEEEAEQAGAHSLEQLRNMFKDEDTKKQIDGVFYFCKYLMKGEADKNAHRKGTNSKNN